MESCPTVWEGRSPARPGLSVEATDSFRIAKGDEGKEPVAAGRALPKRTVRSMDRKRQAL